MTINPLKIGFTPDEFDAYVKKINPRMFTEPSSGAKTPILGAVLHNTYMPDLKMVQGYLDAKKWDEPHLIENWWTLYRQKAWQSGPHIFIFPTKIYVATPLDVRGTHSPSYNRNYWGIEIIGDYSHEILPDNMRYMAERVLKAFYHQIAVSAVDKNFHFHGEDVKSTHHFCPGSGVGPKTAWLAKINSVA
jgi:hypothetical protein